MLHFFDMYHPDQPEPIDHTLEGVEEHLKFCEERNLNPPRMLEHLKEAKDFAIKLGKFDLSDNQSLQNKLKYLENYNENTTCEVYWDSAPYSFGFVMLKNDKVWFNGGLIFHGPHDKGGSGSGPTFAVTLKPTHGWSIHT